MIIERNAVRAIVLWRGGEGAEVLLLELREPGQPRTFWVTPGGAREGDEGPEEALRRELREEVGLTEVPIGAVVWRRQHTFYWVGQRVRQREVYYVVEVPRRFTPVMSDADEAKVVEQMRWWGLDELAASGVDHAPGDLVGMVRRYLADGPPSEAPLEVLED
jgi:8-oxo-dGTP pyrophosphatase MutT (NUDIX family)